MNLKKILAILLVAAVTLSCMAACSGDDTPTTTGAAQELTISQTEMTLDIRQSLILTVESENVVWLSSDSTVASVDGGKVTGIKEGTATVTAIGENGSATCTVTVQNAYYPVLMIVNKASTLFLECDYNMQALVRIGAQQVDAEITWTSSDETVVSVDASGKLTTKAKGTAIITAKASYQGILLEDRVEVRVAGMSYIDAPTRITMGLYAGDAQMEVEHTVYIDKQPVAEKATITSADSEIVSVQDGVLKANKIGTTVITLHYAAGGEDMSVDISVTVEHHVLHTFTKENECYYVGDVKKQNGSTIGEHWTCKKPELKSDIGGQSATRVYLWAYYWNPALSFSLDLTKRELEAYRDLGYTKVVVPVYADSEYAEDVYLTMGNEKTVGLTADGWQEVTFSLDELLNNYDSFTALGTPMIYLKNNWAANASVVGEEVSWYLSFGDIYLR